MSNAFYEKKYKLYWMIITKSWLIIIIYILTTKYISSTHCEEVILPEDVSERKKTEDFILPATYNNIRDITAARLRETLLILEIVRDFSIEIRNLSEKHELALFNEQGNMGLQLYISIRDLITKIITIYGEEQFKNIIDFLISHRAETRDSVIDHIIAVYIGIITNPHNMDQYGILINVNGDMNDVMFHDYLKSLTL